jgi:hypothetical protein
VIGKLIALRERVGRPGASSRAADYLLQHLAAASSALVPLNAPVELPLRKAS